MKDYGTTLFGNCGKDGETRTTQGGKKIASVPIATYLGKEKSTWVTLIAWEGDDTFDLISSASKGKKLGAWGGLDLRTFEKRDGSTGYSLELKTWKAWPIDRDAQQGITDADIPGRQEPDSSIPF